MRSHKIKGGVVSNEFSHDCDANSAIVSLQRRKIYAEAMTETDVISLLSAISMREK